MHKGAAKTQLEQDLIENGELGTQCCVSPFIQADQEPSSKCCRAPYIKVAEDVFRCLGCRLRYTGIELRHAGINTINIR